MAIADVGSTCARWKPRSSRRSLRGGIEAALALARRAPTTQACGSGSARSPRSACTSPAASPPTVSRSTSSNDLEPFSWVVACGLPDVAMTSIAAARLEPTRGPSGRRGARVLSQAHGLRLLRGPRPPPAPRLPGVSGSTPARRRRGWRVPQSRPRPPRTRPERERVTRSRSNPGGMDVLRCSARTCARCASASRPWFKVPPPGGERYRELTELIRSENLHTVCQEAACPNVGECWERGTATFMILGDTCTRRCGFCNVQDRQADLERPARARPCGALDRAHGPAPRGHHLSRPRRSARQGRLRLRRGDPPGPPPGARAARSRC